MISSDLSLRQGVRQTPDFERIESHQYGTAVARVELDDKSSKRNEGANMESADVARIATAGLREYGVPLSLVGVSIVPSSDPQDDDPGGVQP